MRKGLPIASGNDQSISRISIAADVDILLRMSNDTSLETGGSVWHAGVASARYIMANPHLVRGKVVLEIGAGNTN